MANSLGFPAQAAATVTQAQTNGERWMDGWMDKWPIL